MPGKLSWKELKEKVQSLKIICKIGTDYIIVNDWIQFKKDGQIIVNPGTGWVEAQYVTSYNKIWLIIRGLEE